MKKIFIIEDDINLRKYMRDYLLGYDYKVELIQDFNNVEEEVYKSECDLVLLDINLPNFDGFYFLKVIRKHINIPIIIISARSEEAEQIRGIDLGADDYITKPFSMGILLAKINAVLRRSSESIKTIIRYNNVELNCDSMELKCNENIVSLSKNEFKLLKMFLTNLNKVITREDLLDELWDEDTFVDDNTLTVNITRLKKKLLDNNINLTIETKRGIGYAVK